MSYFEHITLVHRPIVSFMGFLGCHDERLRCIAAARHMEPAHG